MEYDQFFDKDTLENENMEIAPKKWMGNGNRRCYCTKMIDAQEDDNTKKKKKLDHNHDMYQCPPMHDMNNKGS